MQTLNTDSFILDLIEYFSMKGWFGFHVSTLISTVNWFAKGLCFYSVVGGHATLLCQLMHLHSLHDDQILEIIMAADNLC